MNKREIIERALGHLIQHDLQEVLEMALSQDSVGGWGEQLLQDLAITLANQAIVIECEVGHDNDEHCPLTTIDYSDAETRHHQVLVIRGTLGTPGKTLAIIIPLEEER